MIPGAAAQFLTPVTRTKGIRLVYLWNSPRQPLIALTVRLEELFGDSEIRAVIAYYNALYGSPARILQPIRAEDITL